MLVLGLDLGTKTGYAIGSNRISSEGTGLYGPLVGTWKLKEPTAKQKRARLPRRCDPRIDEFYDHLCSLTLPDLVVFEDVQFASTQCQAHLWASFRTVVWMAYGRGINVIIECVPVGTLKKFATGHGNATKGMMTAAYQALGFSTFGLDDNAIDAFFLWKWGIEKFNL
jgi:Holliday junction resolvasome RuvABC endonuclease subunit